MKYFCNKINFFCNIMVFHDVFCNQDMATMILRDWHKIKKGDS